MLEFTALAAERIEALIEDGTIHDVVSGALALAWAKVRQRAHVSLVSGGIPRAGCGRRWPSRPSTPVQDALEAALRRHGPQASVNVLTHAPDTLPVPAS